jgi:magnesium transporter
MSRLIKKRSIKTGLPPGSLVHIGDAPAKDTKISVIDYKANKFQEEHLDSFEACFPFKNKKSVTWIDIEGIHQPETFERLGQCYGFHPLVLEDIMATDQRPKMDDYGKYLFIVLKMIDYDTKEAGISFEQVSMILGSNYLISFQEGKEGDVFTTVRERIRNGKGRIRQMGPDYLAYSLIDAIVDNYYSVLEKLGEEIEDLEEKLITDPAPATLHTIQRLKRDMIFLRKSVWPLREVISTLERNESALFSKSTSIYLKDVYDHTIQVIDTIETFRDMLSGMLDIYLTSINNRLSAVMKVLTMIATIFMPLSFIAGVYGMNFKYIPGLEQEWGFAVTISVMITIAGSMLYMFRKKKWF